MPNVESDLPVNTRDDLISHIFRLLDDNDAREWKNDSAYSFLQALAAWIDKSGDYGHLHSPLAEQPTWQFIADALTAAAK